MTNRLAFRSGGAWNSSDLVAAIWALILRQPVPIHTRCCIGYEMGADAGDAWRRDQLCLYWLVPLGELVAVVDGFTRLREAIEELDVVERVEVELYVEPENSGFVDLKTSDVAELSGERWRIAWRNRVRRTHTRDAIPSSRAWSRGPDVVDDSISAGRSWGGSGCSARTAPRGDSRSVTSDS